MQLFNTPEITERLDWVCYYSLTYIHLPTNYIISFSKIYLLKFDNFILYLVLLKKNYQPTNSNVGVYIIIIQRYFIQNFINVD